MRCTLLAALTLAITLGVAADAHAGLVPVQVSVTPEGGMYRYTYAIVLPTDSELRPGDYFTIYDFDGYVADSATVSGGANPVDWSFSTAKIGITPDFTEPVDQPGIDNLTWTYNGPVLGNQLTGLGNFWALSAYPDTTESWFTAQTGSVTGVTDSNITPTVVPVPVAPPPGVPEPTAIVLASIGLPLVAAVGRRRFRSEFKI